MLASRERVREELISVRKYSLIAILGLRFRITDRELFPGEGFDGDAAADGGEEFPEAVDSH